MTKTRKLRWLSVFVTIVMCFCTMSAFPANALKGTGFLKTYTLTGDPEDDIVAVAKAQEGRTKSEMGYTSDWCSHFVGDCAELAGQKSAVPPSGWTPTLKENIITAGGIEVSTPQKGDIVFYYCKSCGREKHAAIAISSTQVVHGNFWYDPDAPSSSYSHVQTYKIGVYEDDAGHKSSNGTIYPVYVRPNYKGGTVISYANVPAGTYYFKNKSTGTYLTVDGAKAANGQNVSVAAKSATKAFQFKITGGTEHYFYSMLNTGFVVNPYSDSPSSGTNVTLYEKDTSGTQIWKFEAVSGGYVIRLKCNPGCVLAANGSNVQLAAYSGAATQIWTLEDATAVPVTLSSIAVNAGTVGTIYENGSTFNPDGMTLTATYSDGTTKTITSGYTIDTVSFATTGQKAVTVNYEGKSASLEITVQDLFEGSGTEEDPYQIATVADLMNLASSINNTNANPCYGTAHYIQTANIDLSGIDWTPIGIFYESPSSDTLTNFAAFKGVYDGNYKKITNLKVDYDRNYAGLFGKTNHAVIHSLDVSGEVTGSGVCVGGIVGELSYDSLICYCNFSGRVNGADCVGGLVGKIRGGSTIESCYANAYVIAAGESSTAGGIVGYDQTGFSEACTDTICAANYFAGSVGGTVTGGISGTSENGTAKECTVTFVNNYYLNSAASGAIAGEADTGCMPLIASQLKTIAEDLAEPFVTNKSDAKNDGYPLFYWQQVAEVVYGDTNQDSHVTIVDVIMLNKYVMGAEQLDEFQLEASDVDLNGKADASDSLIILKSLVDLIESLPLV